MGAEFPSATTSAKTFILEISAETVGGTDLSYIESFVVIHTGVRMVYVKRCFEAVFSVMRSFTCSAVDQWPNKFKCCKHLIVDLPVVALLLFKMVC